MPGKKVKCIEVIQTDLTGIRVTITWSHLSDLGPVKYRFNLPHDQLKIAALARAANRDALLRYPSDSRIRTFVAGLVGWIWWRT